MSKAAIRYVKSLQDKKLRQKYSQFIVEGEKSITELLKSDFKIVKLYALEDFIHGLNLKNKSFETIVVDAQELKQMSSHQAPQKALALVQIPDYGRAHACSPLVLGLDEIQDPGNLGTIIRIADWYGISHVFCSKGCTDVYNPKCINSTMGSFLRVKVVYGDLKTFSEELNRPMMVAVLNGHNVHNTKLPNRGMLVIGNEGHGINPQIIESAMHKLTIPRFGGAESLNAAISTAILLDNLLRQ